MYTSLFSISQGCCIFVTSNILWCLVTVLSKSVVINLLFKNNITKEFLLIKSFGTNRLTTKCTNMLTNCLLTSLLFVKSTDQAPHIPIDWIEEIRPLKQTSIFNQVIEFYEDTATNMRTSSNTVNSKESHGFFIKMYKFKTVLL